MKDFIDKNRAFWKRFPIKEKGPRLLIENIKGPRAIHALNIFVVMLNLSRKYQPVWIGDIPDSQKEINRSYVPSATNLVLPWLSYFEKKLSRWLAMYHYILVKLGFRIVNLRLFGIKYGDLLYDTYLRNHSVATISKIDFEVLRLIRIFSYNILQYKKVIKKGEYDAVLVSHRVGLRGGLMTRIAALNNIEVYSTQGYHYSTIDRSTTVADEFKFPYEPTDPEFQEVLNTNDFEGTFNSFLDSYISGEFNKARAFAFTDSLHSQQDKNSFCEANELDPNKKLAFVMIHAFSDYPHSTFKETMYFNDYFDWFIKTLEHAKKDTSVNWIFKQHPYSSLYPTKDFDFDIAFNNIPSHIKYFSADMPLNALGVSKLADVVVTCAGSAGYEIPSLGNCYSITAGPNHYNKLKFSIHPQSLKEYYKVLGEISEASALNAEKKKLAQAVFLFVSRCSMVRFSAIPDMSFTKMRSEDIEEWYWDLILECYEKNASQIQEEMEDYAEKMASPDFSSLRSTLSPKRVETEAN